jgi:hypothetical protein
MAKGGNAARVEPEAEEAAIAEAIGQLFKQRVFLFHGDKGGVGKSFMCHAFTDQARERGLDVAVIEADTRNPDVIRIFEGQTVCQMINLRRDDGWMDVIDFVREHPTHHIVISLPAGIGDAMQKEFEDFCGFLKTKVPGKPEVVMFWLMNLFADSVNLLHKTVNTAGPLIEKIIVVRNLIFGDQDQFFIWDESPFRVELERKGVATTISLPRLHLRVTSKLGADPDGMMPFSQAVKNAEAFKLLVSEQWKLENYLNKDLVQPMNQVWKFVGL